MPAGERGPSLTESVVQLVEEEEGWQAHNPGSRGTVKPASPIPWMPKDPLTNWERCLARAPFEVSNRFFFSQWMEKLNFQEVHQALNWDFNS